MASASESKTVSTTGKPPGDRWLHYAAYLFGAALIIHGADHFRRGFEVLTPQIYWAGQITTLLSLAAIVLVLVGHRLAAPLAVFVGFFMALGVSAVHLLPHWGSFSDAFPGSDVDMKSYTAVITEIVSALLFGAAGAYSLWNSRALKPQTV